MTAILNTTVLWLRRGKSHNYGIGLHFHDIQQEATNKIETVTIDLSGDGQHRNVPVTAQTKQSKAISWFPNRPGFEIANTCDLSHRHPTI